MAFISSQKVKYLSFLTTKARNWILKVLYIHVNREFLGATHRVWLYDQRSRFQELRTCRTSVSPIATLKKVSDSSRTRISHRKNQPLVVTHWLTQVRRCCPLSNHQLLEGQQRFSVPGRGGKTGKVSTESDGP